MNNMEALGSAKEAFDLLSPYKKENIPQSIGDLNGRNVAVLVTLIACASVLVSVAVIIAAIFASYILVAICAAAFVTLSISTILASRIDLSQPWKDLIVKMSAKVKELFRPNLNQNDARKSQIMSPGGKSSNQKRNSTEAFSLARLKQEYAILEKTLQAREEEFNQLKSMINQAMNKNEQNYNHAVSWKEYSDNLYRALRENEEKLEEQRRMLIDKDYAITALTALIDENNPIIQGLVIQNELCSEKVNIINVFNNMLDQHREHPAIINALEEAKKALLAPIDKRLAIAKNPQTEVI